MLLLETGPCSVLPPRSCRLGPAPSRHLLEGRPHVPRSSQGFCLCPGAVTLRSPHMVFLVLPAFCGASGIWQLNVSCLFWGNLRRYFFRRHLSPVVCRVLGPQWHPARPSRHVSGCISRFPFWFSPSLSRPHSERFPRPVSCRVGRPERGAARGRARSRWPFYETAALGCSPRPCGYRRACGGPTAGSVAGLLLHEFSFGFWPFGLACCGAR